LEDKVEASRKVYERVSATEATQNRVYDILVQTGAVLDDLDKKMEEAYAFATTGMVCCHLGYVVLISSQRCLTAQGHLPLVPRRHSRNPTY
jgi:hypothetical protein